jgi:predicted GIY-YIG superfamily endonuclease
VDHRVSQHKAILLYTEVYENKHEAAKRERQIKGWRREKKLLLIDKGKRVRG